MVAAHGHAGPGDVQRNRPDPLVGVGLDLLGSPQNGHGPVTEVVVEPLHGPDDDPFGLLPGPPFGEHRLESPADEQRLEERLLGLVEQQVAMVAAIGGEEIVEDDSHDRFGLFHLAEGRRGLLELL